MNQPTYPYIHKGRLLYTISHLIASVILLALIVGCDSTTALKRTIKQCAMEYEKHPTEYNLTALAHSYGLLLEAQIGDTVQPGCFAEYGVTLALLGKNSEANRMFNNEVMLYPNTARYVRQLKLQLVPEYLSDTVCDTSTLYIIDMIDQGDSEKKTISAKDSLQQAKAMQRQLREEAKRQKTEAKKAANEQREIIKSIRAKEKEQRDLERQKAQKAKEQAKKDAAKQKKAAAKAKAQAKKEAERTKAEQRKAQAHEKARKQRDNDEE